MHILPEFLRTCGYCYEDNKIKKVESSIFDIAYHITCGKCDLEIILLNDKLAIGYFNANDYSTYMKYQGGIFHIYDYNTTILKCSIELTHDILKTIYGKSAKEVVELIKIMDLYR
jgi:hypothetical protein